MDVTTSKPVLKIVGEDGNAFFILGKARKVAKQNKWSKQQIKTFTDEAMGGNYAHLLCVCMKYFTVK
jgi:hypothetical protein